MQFPVKYNCLMKNEFVAGDFKIVPIRYKDRFTIMKWRNEQMYHLRQNELLTEKSQDDYFNGTVVKIFGQKKPNQLLFSYLKNEKLIGYGGLVHINWKDKNAEISFIMDTKFEEKFFQFHWSNFLKLTERLAFGELDFHKIYVYAFDLRPHLYKILKVNNYFKDAILKDHCYFNNNFLDVVIHSKIKNS